MDVVTHRQDLEEVLDLAISGVNARDDAFKVWETLRDRRELLFECRMVEQVLHSIKPGIDVFDIAERHAQPNAEESLAYHMLR